MSKVKRKKIQFKSIASDVFLFLGFSSMTAGLYVIHPAAALIGAGVMLIYSGIPKKKESQIHTASMPLQKQIQPRKI